MRVAGYAIAGAALLAAGAAAMAQQQNAELDALALADQVPATAPAAQRDWAAMLETAATAIEPRDGDRRDGGEAALDLRAQRALGAGVSLVGAARLGRFDPPQPGMKRRSLVMLKEAYLSWKAGPTIVADIGRVNLRQGVAVGYNPTDFFRAGAVVGNTADPDARRTNRLGSVMVRAQRLSDDGAVALLFAPRLAGPYAPGDPAADSALQRTNGVDRWMLSASQRLGTSFQPQALLYGERGQPVQLGLNANFLASDAALVYAEWAGGRQPALSESVAGCACRRAFRARSAIGVTYTLPFDVSVTVEWETNGAGMSAAQAHTAAFANPLAWGRTLQWAASSQEAVTRHTAFAYLRANNVVVNKFDVSAIAQRDTDDAGRQYWLELRQRGNRADLALQFQRQSGDPWTRFGAFPERSRARLLLDYYF